MATVGSASRVDGVDLQLMVNASAFAHTQAGAATTHAADGEPDTRISAAGKLRSATSAVLDAASLLKSGQTWQATKATSSDDTLVLAVSNKAAPGSYKINVDAVATAQTTTSATFSSLATVVGIGTLDLQLGSWNTSTSTFAMNPNWPKATVTFGPKDTSLEQVRDKINAAGVGVIATVVSDATGNRLVLRSTSTGSDNGFKGEAYPAKDGDRQAAQAMSAMGFNPTQMSGGAELTQPAQDAQVRIDGRSVQSAQNLMEDTPSGLTLRLNGQSTGSTIVHVEPDDKAMAKDIKSFAQAYNNMVSQLDHADSTSGDVIVRDARAIQHSMIGAFQSRSDGNELGSQLQSIGLSMNSDGRFAIDERRLSRALAQDPSKVAKLFDAADVADQSSGLATRLLSLATQQSTPAAPFAGSQPATATVADTPTSAGALYRQRLLEQYAATSSHEDESAMAVNEA
jgi:flagellar hook-associated protein 2